MKNQDHEARIAALLKEMTLEEKVGQLRQCGPSIVGAFEVSFSELLDMMFDGKISKEEFDRLMSSAEQDYREEDLRAGRIGSYNGISDAATADRLQRIAVEESRLGIPVLFGCDVIHGFRTVTPIPLAESCAWDPGLWERTARVAAKEATAAGVHLTFAPMVDVAKDARWGRVSEGAGEDALLAARYGVAKVKGFQTDDPAKNDSMAACVKHFAGYGAAEAGRDYNRVDLSMQRLYEEYLPSYEACVKEGALAVMPAFNDINGVPCSVSRWLLTDLLRDTWGFDGMTISDANAIAECVVHGIAEDRADAAGPALAAGMDMDMTSEVYYENLAELVKTGVVKESDLDRAVADVLRVKFALGLFDHPYQTSVEREEQAFLKPEYRALARETAVKSMVLLKNENLLPLSRERKIGIVGPLADAGGQMLGAWAVNGKDEDCVSLVDACRAQGISFVYESGIRAGGAEDAAPCGAEQSKRLEDAAPCGVNHIGGAAADPAEDAGENAVSAVGTGKESGAPCADPVDHAAILRLAKECDVIIAAVGETKDMSGEAASRASIMIPEEQIALLRAVKETGKQVVTVLFNGRPLAIPETAELSDAILEAWHPGVEAGNAILDLLFGDENPAGKLTTTFPYTTGQCPMYYAHINTGRPGGRGKFTSKYLDTPLTPLYPFGYGLSYTSYEYEEFRLEEQEEGVRVTVKVKNTGDRAGGEIVQCYLCDETAQRVRPVKQLKDFKKIALAAGETKEVEFVIPYRDMGYYDREMNYIVEEGWFTVFVGRNSEDCLSGRFELDGTTGDNERGEKRQ